MIPSTRRFLQRAVLGIALTVLACGCSTCPEATTTTATPLMDPSATPPAAAGDTVLEVLLCVPGVPVTTVYLPTGEQRVPVIVFLQGAQVPAAAYSQVARVVASYGFAVAVPDNTALLGRFADVATLPGLLDALRAADQSDDSPLVARLDVDRLGLIGHSFGGAAALQAVQGQCAFPFCTAATPPLPGLQAVSVFGASLVDPSTGALPALDSPRAAVQFIQGTIDSVSEGVDARATFDALVGEPKAFVELVGGNHYSVTDTAQPGPATDPVPATLDRDTGLETTGRWMAAFMLQYLREDAIAEGYLQSGEGLVDAHVRVDLVP